MTGVQVQVCTEGKTSSLRAAEAVSAHLYSSLSVRAITSLITEISRKKKEKRTSLCRVPPTFCPCCDNVVSNVQRNNQT